MQRNNFIFISYYTKETGYELDVENLKASIRYYRLQYCIEAVDNKGSWQLNTQLKAHFIQQMLLRFPGYDIVFIDADAVVERYPDQFHFIREDFAAYFKYDVELLSGTVFFKNNDRSLDLISRWINQNERNPNVLEQKNLQAVVPRWISDGGNLYKLPQTYCYIFDDKRRDHRVGEPADPVVIRHYQASRKYREAVRA